MNKLFTILLSLSLLLSFKIKATEESLYQTVGNLVLESENYVSKPINGQIGQKQDEKTPEQRLEQTLNKLDELHKTEIVYNLLSQFGSLKPNTKTIEPYVLRELSLICGSELSKKINLFQHIDKTNTSFGSAVLARMLSEPQTDKNIISQRKNIIKLLIEDKDLFNKLNKALKEIKEYENELLNYWNHHAQLDPELTKRVYYTSESGLTSFNKSTFALENNKRLLLLAFGFVTAADAMALATYAIAPHLNRGFDRQDHFELQFRPTPLSVGFSILINGLICFSYKKMIDEVKLYNNICRTISRRVKGVSKASESLDKLYFAIKNDDELIGGLKSFEQLKKFVTKPQEISNDFEYIKNLLEDDVFNQDVTWTSNKGKILAAHKYIEDLKNQFIPALEVAGELDAYLSIAKLIKEYEEKNVKYCFVEFINNNKPYIELQNVWNPLIDINKVVTENITFGKPDHAHNVMLTGPHGGGKSTFMKSIAYSILLAQTFGIAPASKAKLTIFDKINTYVNIKEDLAQGQSTFMAEKKRVDDITSVLANLKPQEKAFTIMDEVFKGTMEDEGSRRLYNFGKNIANYQNAMCVIATHFQQPADLEKDTNSDFTNYHVGLIEQDDKTFIRSFKLIKGKNDWWFNDRNKRERYIDWLTSLE